MKSKLSLTLLFLATVFSCRDDDSLKRNYPTLVTLAVKDINTSGATFHGEIKAYDLSKIKDHGFVWGKSNNLSLINSSFISLGKATSSDFSSVVRFSLESGAYFLRSYAVTNDAISVYGPHVTFVSMGSEGPRILSITPSDHKVCDTLTISGKNFIPRAFPEVKINSTKFNVAKYLPANNEIKVIASRLLPRTNSVEVNFDTQSGGKISAELKQSPLSVVSISPTIYSSLEPLRIKFNHSIACLGIQAKLSSSDKFQPDMFSIKGNEIWFGTANDCFTDNFKVQVYVDEDLFFESPVIVVDQPKINAITPFEANLNDLITISGENFPKVSYLIFSDQYIEPISASVNEIKFLLPYQARVSTDGNLNFQIQFCSGKRMAATMKLKPPSITSIYPTKITKLRQLLTINGTGFRSETPYDHMIETFNHHFGIVTQTVTSTSLQAVYEHNSFPEEGVYEIGKIRLNVAGTVVVSDVDVEVNIAPAFQPIADFPGQAREGAIALSVGSKGYIGLGTDGSSFLKDIWEYDPATNMWTRLPDFPGQGRTNASAAGVGATILVGLGDNGNETYADIWSFNTTSSTWTKRPDYPAGPRTKAISFSSGELVFFGGGVTSQNAPDTDLWSFNLVTNNWAPRARMNSSGNENSHYFKFNETFFHYTAYPLTRNCYNPTTDKWTSFSVGSAPSNNPITNSTGAYHFYSTALGKLLPNCESVIGDEYSFTSLGFSIPQNVVGFTIGENIYIGLGRAQTLSRKFWLFKAPL